MRLPEDKARPVNLDGAFLFGKRLANDDKPTVAKTKLN